MKKQLIFIMVVFAFLVGCPKEAPTAEESLRLGLKAQIDGNTQEAIRHYKDAVRQSSDLATAHFDLAILLQDSDSDPAEVYYHFRTFLDLQPASQRATIALERMRRAEEDLENLISVRTRSTNAVAILRRQLDELTQTLQEKEKNLTETQGIVNTLTQRNEQLEKDVERLDKRIQLLLDMPVATKEKEEEKQP